MKSATLFLFSVLIFLFTAPSLSTSILRGDDDLVLDIQGNPLEKDVGYFVSLPFWGAASGLVSLTPPIQINETCGADVILNRPALFPDVGTRFTFTPVNESEDAIRVGSPLAIQSPTLNPCGDSTIWQISSREGFLNPIITIGGIINTTPSCFRIVKFDSPFTSTPVYEFQHCSGTCGPTKEATSCLPVGITLSESRLHLSVGGSPLWFYFTKDYGFGAKQEM